jgi:hypothetical protein
MTDFHTQMPNRFGKLVCQTDFDLPNQYAKLNLICQTELPNQTELLSGITKLNYQTELPN